MTIEISVPASRDDWLKDRAATVGASEIAALFGRHDWLTARELWENKAGKIARSVEETPPMRRGRLLEDDAIDIMREDYPEWVITPNPIPGGKHYRDIAHGISATPDAFVTIPQRDGFGVVQIKSVEPSVFRDKWLRNGTVIASDGLAVQATQEAYLTGASYAWGGALVVGHGVELHLIEIPLVQGMFIAILREAQNFWTSIAQGAPPAFDFDRDEALIARLYPFTTPGKTVDVSGDNELPALAAEDAWLKNELTTIKARRQRIKAQFLAALGDAETAFYNGQTIASAKTIHVKGYEVAPTSYRQLTIRKST